MYVGKYSYLCTRITPYMPERAVKVVGDFMEKASYNALYLDYWTWEIQTYTPETLQIRCLGVV